MSAQNLKFFLINAAFTILIVVLAVVLLMRSGSGQKANTTSPSPTPQQVVQNEPQQQPIPKTDKPKVELFVMSFCPYGNQAEDTMMPVYNLLKSKADWNIHFIVSVSGNTVNSLHGPNEVTEDEREACVIQNSGLDKWWQVATYVNNKCGSDGSCWQDAVKASGLDSATINSCVSSKSLKSMTKEATASSQAGVSGSPTLILNGTTSNAVYQYGNSQAYLDAICSAFNTQPAECKQVLGSATTTQAPSGGGCATQ